MIYVDGKYQRNTHIITMVAQCGMEEHILQEIKAAVYIQTNDGLLTKFKTLLKDVGIPFYESKEAFMARHTSPMEAKPKTANGYPVALFYAMKAMDDPDAPDGAWQQMLEDTATLWAKENNYTLDSNDAFHAYLQWT